MGVAGRDDDGVLSRDEDLELIGDISVLECRMKLPRSASVSGCIC